MALQYNPQDFAYGAGMGGASGAAGYDLSGLGQYNQPATPAIPGQATGAGIGGLGLNIPTAQLALGGISALGGIFNAFNAQKLAKKQFEYTKSVTDTNLANSIQSYNTTLQDRARARAAMEGQSPEQQAAYVQQNSLARR